MRACLSPCLSQSLSLSLSLSLAHLFACLVCICVGADSDSLKSLSGHRQIYSIHPPLLPLPLPLHTHILSCCRPWHRHQTLHNFRRPSASAQYAGRPFVWTVCPCPCVRLSLCPLWSPGLAVWTHFQSVYVKTSTVTLRHAETLRAEALALCVV